MRDTHAKRIKAVAPVSRECLGLAKNTIGPVGPRMAEVVGISDQIRRNDRC